MGFPAYVRQNQPIDRWLIDLVKLRWPHGEVTPFHLRIPTWPYASQGMWPIRSPALNHWAQEHAIQDGIKRWSLYENWLVVSTPLKNISQLLITIPNIWKNKKCYKPPTRIDISN